MKIQVHEKELPYVKLLCWVIGILGTIIFAGASFWCTWVSTSLIDVGKNIASYAIKIDDIQKNVEMIANKNNVFSTNNVKNYGSK